MDPLIKSQLLYQLSYTPVASGEMGGAKPARKGLEHFQAKACPGLDPGWTQFAEDNVAEAIESRFYGSGTALGSDAVRRLRARPRGVASALEDEERSGRDEKPMAWFQPSGSFR